MSPTVGNRYARHRSRPATALASRRRLCVLLALVALVSAILTGSDGSAEARARRRKVKRRAPSPAARVLLPPETTPTDLIPRRLLILGFDGHGAQVARGAVIDRLRTIGSLNLVPLRPTDAQRIGTSYGAAKTVNLANRLNLTAVLYGEVTKVKPNIRVKLMLANGEDGQIVGDIWFEARAPGTLRTKIRAQIWAKLEQLIDRAASPGPPETAVAEVAPEKPAGKPVAKPAAPPEEPPAEPEGQEGAEGPSPTAPIVLQPGPRNATPPARTPEGISAEAPTARCSVVELSTGGGAMFRRFNYRDEQRGALRGYTLYRAPVGQIEGSVYPYATGRCGLLSGVGLRFAYGRMAPVTSQLADRQLVTQASDYQAEVVLRIARGAFTLQPAIGYFVRQYSVEPGVVPAAAYRALGATFDVGLRIRFVSIELGAGARRIVDAGTLRSADWFPGASGFALAGRAQLGVAVTRWIDVVATGATEYDSFDLRILPGGTYPNGVAAGAYDFYLQGVLSVRVRLGLGAP